MLKIFEKHKLNLDKLTDFVGKVYGEELLQAPPSRNIIREKLISNIPDIMSLFKNKIPQYKDYTSTDRVMQVIEESNHWEIPNYEIKDAIIQISSQPINMSKVEALVNDIMLGNESVTRR